VVLAPFSIDVMTVLMVIAPHGSHGKFLSVLMPKGPCAKAPWDFRSRGLNSGIIYLLDAQVRSFQMAMTWCVMALRVKHTSKSKRANAREVGLFIAAFILKRKGRRGEKIRSKEKR